MTNPVQHNSTSPTTIRPTTTAEEKNQQNQYTNTSSSSNYTEPGVLYDLYRIKDAYNEVLGPLNTIIGEYIDRIMKAGMETDVIINAIHETAWAKWPSPYYLRAILQRYLADGILTSAQLHHDIVERQDNTSSKRADREHHWYDEE